MQGAACLIVPQKISDDGINSANLTTAGLEFILENDESGDTFNEDCLTLNVWTKPQTGESKKAVMLWIYGGSFTTGYAGMPTYNGQYIADQEDVVVVSIKYEKKTLKV